MRQSSAVAHEERKTTINQNLLIKKEQGGESELGWEEMRKRGENTRGKNLLFSLALSVDCCVYDADSLWRKARTLTKSALVPWLLSQNRVLQITARDPCLRNKAQSYICADPESHGAENAVCDALP